MPSYSLVTSKEYLSIRHTFPEDKHGTATTAKMNKYLIDVTGLLTSCLPAIPCIPCLSRKIFKTKQTKIVATKMCGTTEYV